MIETERLYLRKWQMSDAEAVYDLSKEPEIGYNCGWKPHKDVAESRFVLEYILINKNNMAIVEKETDRVVGSFSFIPLGDSPLVCDEDEIEIGFWMGKPYWGKGYTTEVCKRMMQYAFEKMGINKIWIQHNINNLQSKRVQEKCGFVYHHTIDRKYYLVLDEYRTNIVNYITKEMWEQNK